MANLGIQRIVCYFVGWIRRCPCSLLGGEMDQHFNYWDWVARAPANTVISTIIGALLANGGVDKLEQEAMAGVLNQTRLHGLQAQLSPHVLHNSLNGLAELVHQNPIKAEKGILGLSMLYRQFLNFSSKQKECARRREGFY